METARLGNLMFIILSKTHLPELAFFLLLVIKPNINSCIIWTAIINNFIGIFLFWSEYHYIIIEKQSVNTAFKNIYSYR